VTETEKKAIEDKIRELDVRWGEAACRKDLDAVVDVYASDGTLVWPGQEAVHGTDDIRKNWAEMLKIPGLYLKFTPERLDVAEGGDLVIDFGRVDLGQETEEGPVREVDKYLVVWQLVDGAWKVLYDSYNGNKAG
jgi:ketosteroid isomerase-like protein